MITVMFTDTHYGWKQNSTTWLDFQMKLLDDQLIPELKKLKSKDSVRLIHLGDVFDSRSSICPMVARAVVKRFVEMSDIVDEFYIIAGNHDFYSPNSDDIDSLTMVFSAYPRIKLVIKEAVISGDNLLIPWYCYKDHKHTDDIIKQYNIKNIYTHADIFGEDRWKHDVNIFSGHIHIPQIDEKKRLYNLGSCYSLNFADFNQDRYFYIYDSKLRKVENEDCIRFWRLTNEEIFNHKKYSSKDYYELYVDQTNMGRSDYQDKITDITKTCKNISIIPIINQTISDEECFEMQDMSKLCATYIPEHLMDKYNIILDQVESNKKQSIH